MDERRPINIQTATDAQLKSIDGIYQSKSRRLIKKRDEKGILLKEDFVECTGVSMEEIEELISQKVVDFDPFVTKKELADEIKTQLEPFLRAVKDTQIELQEAQTKIMEALSVSKQVSQSNENLVTQIDLQNLKKELSTELKYELVNEIRKNYEEIDKLSKTPVNITQQLLTFSINLKKEIAEQLKGSREEVVRNTDKRLHQLQETTIIQINNDIDILNKKCSTLYSKVNEMSSEAKGEMSVHMIDLNNELESMEESVDRQQENKLTICQKILFIDW
jgi:hypothetical protein